MHNVFTLRFRLLERLPKKKAAQIDPTQGFGTVSEDTIAQNESHRVRRTEVQETKESHDLESPWEGTSHLHGLV